jgi:hypothetical protein
LSIKDLVVVVVDDDDNFVYFIFRKLRFTAPPINGKALSSPEMKV